MKILNNRQDLAKAVNFGKHPVVTIDLASLDDYGLRGSKIRVNAGKFSSGEPFIINAEIRVYRDELKLTTSAGATCLHDSFSYSDYIEMAEYAAAPMISPDQDVVVMVHNSNTREAYAAAMVHTGARVNRFSSTPLGFESADFSTFMNMAIVSKK